MCMLINANAEQIDYANAFATKKQKGPSMKEYSEMRMKRTSKAHCYSNASVKANPNRLTLY